MSHRASLTAAVVFAATVAPARAQPASYTISRPGLHGPEYTSQSGAQNSSAWRLSRGGVLVGRSERFNGGGSSLGFAAWRHENGVSQRLGLLDAPYTGPAGAQNSFPVAVHQSGDIIGYSTRYVGNPGNAAWLFHAGTTTRLGLLTPPYTGADGSQSSYPSAINAGGAVAGYSRQYPETAEQVYTGWVYANGVHTPLELTDPEHTSPNGIHGSTAFFINDAGDVAGNATRFIPGDQTGTSAWLYHAGGILRVGLYDAAHTSSGGLKRNSAYGLTSSGLVVGNADFFGAAGFTGESSWISDGLTTSSIGLTSGVHTSIYGQHYSNPVGFNNSGQVIGRAFRYGSGAGSNGESAWLYQGGVTTRIGLTGPGYVDDNGFEFAQAQYINERGDVLGNSMIYSPPTVTSGRAVWVYHDGVVRRVGLFGPLQTSPTHNQISDAWGLNARGDAIGTSERYANNRISTEGWYYDRATDTTYSLLFSTNSHGEGFSNAAALTDEGVVLGAYLKYDGDTPLGGFAYRWTLAGGMQELGPLVQGGLGAAGWDSLALVYGGPLPGSWDGSFIVGLGYRTGDSNESLYFLAPGTRCGSADFDCDGDTATDADIESFFACLAGGCPAPPCTSTADFNGDGDVATDADIESFFRVLGGGAC